MALRIRAAIAAIVLVAATGIGQWAFAGWEFTSAVQETAQGVRHASCSASLAIGSGGQVRIGNPVRYLGLHVGRATVDSRRAVGGEELKPRLTIVGFGPHHTRSRRSEFGPEARCWLERDATDGTYSTACELATTEHRITYQGIGGDSRRHEAWVLVGSILRGNA